MSSHLNPKEVTAMNFLPYKKPLLIIAFIAALAVVSQWAYKRSHTVYLDDAHIASNIVSIASRVPGWIESFPIHGGQTVDQSTVLAQIDSRQTVLALRTIELKISNQKLSIERAETKLLLVSNNVDNQLTSSQAMLERSEAGTRKAESVLAAAQSAYDRSKSMWAKKLISAQQWDKTRFELSKSSHAYEETQAQRHQAQSELVRATAALQERQLQTKTLEIMHSELELLEVEKNNLQLALADRSIRSPLANAVIDKTFVHDGEYVPAGRRLLMLHDPNDIWISAKVKETEVRHIKAGASANVYIDAYPGESFEATVERIDHATTSQFALLPNPNPSGNFTKVTQRLSLRLSIQQKDGLLKPGMMVEVEIDTRD